MDYYKWTMKVDELVDKVKLIWQDSKNNNNFQRIGIENSLYTNYPALSSPSTVSN